MFQITNQIVRVFVNLDRIQVLGAMLAHSILIDNELKIISGHYQFLNCLFGHAFYLQQFSQIFTH